MSLLRPAFFANNILGQLQSGITAVATQANIGVSAGTALGAQMHFSFGEVDYYRPVYLTITKDATSEIEIVLCTGAFSDGVVNIVRAQQGTTAIAFDAADVVGAYDTRDALAALGGGWHHMEIDWVDLSGGNANRTLTARTFMTQFPFENQPSSPTRTFTINAPATQPDEAYSMYSGMFMISNKGDYTVNLAFSGFDHIVATNPSTLIAYNSRLYRWHWTGNAGFVSAVILEPLTSSFAA